MAAAVTEFFSTVDPNAVMTEFFSAVAANDTSKVLQMINSKKVDVNTKYPAKKNRTALHIAALEAYNELAKTLVDNCKADMSIKDQNNDLPINLAANCYNIDLVKFFVSRNSPRINDVKELLNKPTTEEFFDAVKTNNITRVKELLNSKAVDVDARNAGDYKRTGLHVAATKGYEELVDLLVNDYKADVNIDDEIGELPLHNAADNGHPKIVRFLAGKGSRNVEDVQDILDGLDNAS